MNILKDLRARTGRKQADVAAAAGISREYLSALENGRYRLVRDLAEKLAAIYGVSPADLMGYQLPDAARQLKDERDAYLKRIDQMKADHAREIQARQAEIDRLNAQVAQLRHDIEFFQSMCSQMIKQNNPLEDTASKGENA